MSATQDLHEENKDKTEIQKFIDKFSPVCRIMKEVKPKQKGYYWDFLAPYFIEMNDKTYLNLLPILFFLPYRTKMRFSTMSSIRTRLKNFIIGLKITTGNNKPYEQQQVNHLAGASVTLVVGSI